MKQRFITLFIILYSLFTPRIIFAEYVLPYPSYMPGNTMYRLGRTVDKLKYYWFWGNVGRIKYHLALSDKYLVEAKTLMEYKQYLLGVDALKRSDYQFTLLPEYVSGAKNKNIDISKLQELVFGAAAKHIEVIDDIESSVPDQFTWTPEKLAATELQLWEMMETSREVRKNIAGKTGSL